MPGLSTASHSLRHDASTLSRRDVLLVVGVFLFTRVLCFAGLAVASVADPRQLGEVLTVFDGGHYASIVANGYPSSVPVDDDGVARSTIAFFPVFPAVVAGPVALGVPFTAAAAALNLLAGMVAAVLVSVIVARYAGRRTAVGAAALWSAQPSAFVLTLAYSEALYCAFAFGALALAQRSRWLLGGVVAALASATRPSGVVLAGCFGCAALLALREGAPERFRALAAALLAPVGTAAYLGWTWWRTGRADAWIATQREGWGVYSDGGVDTARRVAQHLADPLGRPTATVVAVAAVVVVLLLVAAVRDAVVAGDRAALLPLLFATATVVLALTTRNVLSSTPRFVLPAMGFLIVPLVLRLQVRRSRPPDDGPVLGSSWVLALTAASALVMSAGGAYITVVSEYPP